MEYCRATSDFVTFLLNTITLNLNLNKGNLEFD